MKKISIITVCLNAERTIKQTLLSIKNQKFKNIEHIIFDGKSTDRTLEIVNQYKISNSKVVSEKDNGFYHAINKAISHCKGDIIGIINADDSYSDSSVLYRIANEFDSNNEIEACYGNLNYVSQDNPSKVIRKWIGKPYKEKLFLYGWMPAHPTFFVKKEVYQKFGNFRLDLGTAADYEIMLRFIYKQKIKVAYINKLFINMSIGGMSNNNIKSRIIANKMDKKSWIVNNLKPKIYTILLKPIRKVFQWI